VGALVGRVGVGVRTGEWTRGVGCRLGGTRVWRRWWRVWVFLVRGGRGLGRVCWLRLVLPSCHSVHVFARLIEELLCLRKPTSVGLVEVIEAIELVLGLRGFEYQMRR